MAKSGTIKLVIDSAIGRWFEFAWQIESSNTLDRSQVVTWALRFTPGNSVYGQGMTEKAAYSVDLGGEGTTGEIDFAFPLSSTSKIVVASGRAVARADSSGAYKLDYSVTVDQEPEFPDKTMPPLEARGTLTLDKIQTDFIFYTPVATLGGLAKARVVGNGNWSIIKMAVSCGDMLQDHELTPHETEPNYYEWYPPLELAKYDGSAKSVPVLYTVTISDRRTATTKTVTLRSTCMMTVPAACALKVTGVSIADAADPSGRFGGFYYAGISKLHISFTFNDAVTEDYGTELSEFNAAANGAKYTETDFETGLLIESGGHIEATAVDSRGVASSYKTDLDNIRSINRPFISKFTAERCDQAGTLDQRGTFCKCVFSYRIDDRYNNIVEAVNVGYRQAGTTGEYTTISTGVTVKSATDQAFIFPLPDGNTYDVVLTVVDYFQDATKTTTVAPGYTIMHFKANGQGIGIGTIAETDGLTVAMPAIFNESLLYNFKQVSHANLDEITHAGDYYISYTENPPEEGAEFGFLRVLSNKTQEDVYQIFHSSRGEVFRRWVDRNGNYTPWDKDGGGKETENDKGYFFKIGSLLLCWGVAKVAFNNGDQYTTVYFPANFKTGTKPVVLSQQVFNSANVTALETRIFTNRVQFAASSVTTSTTVQTRDVGWLAVGLAEE